MVRIALAAVVALLVPLAGLAQMPAGENRTPAPQAGTQDAQRLHLAISSVEYPVTPSDVYRLTYHQSTLNIESLDVQVASDLMVDLGLFGQINAKGLTFIELKRKAEALVGGIFSRSYPAFAIQSVGSFSVEAGGGFLGLARVNAWGLSRMSEVIAESGIKGASLRNVALLSSDGTSVTFDTLLARYSSRPIVNPIVKPGDRIVLAAAGRSVRLAGEVLRPGDYEVLPGEGLQVLVETFGGGPSILAALSKVRIDRMTSSGLAAEYVSLPDAYEHVRSLRDCLTVIVPSWTDAASYVWFEGAVLSPQTDPLAGQGIARAAAGNAAAATAGSAVARFFSPIVQGQRLSDVLAVVRERFSPMADLSAASLIRGNDEPVALNLLAVMAGTAPQSDRALMPNDRVLIPALATTVNVAGAVVSPGIYPFERGMRAAHYIDLGGGSDPLRTVDGEFTITSPGGEQRGIDGIVQPGDRIFLRRNVGDVTVSGAVYFPGVFPTRADATAKYFLNRAGGIDPDRSGDGSFQVTDQSGSPVSPDAILKGGENIYVPINNAGITVSGGVYTPGVFPARADATVKYFLNRAGGIDPDRNSDGSFLITDQSGRPVSPEAILKGGENIYVPINNMGITVSGGVYTPGAFPARADATAKYFLNRAGGIDPDRNSDGSFRITDRSGRPVSPEAILKGGENIYVPINNVGITVSGGVYSPGVFPFRADATALSYIKRAGGIDPERNAKGTYVVTDHDGKKQKSNAPLKSGDSIHIPVDSFSYNFLRYMPVISNLVTLFIVLVPFILAYLPK